MLVGLKLREKCPNTEFFWSVFSHIWTVYGVSPNVGKYGPEKLRIWTIFTQCKERWKNSKPLYIEYLKIRVIILTVLKMKKELTSDYGNCV